MERKRVLVAFADILGFGGWMRRASNAPEVTRDLINRVYDRFGVFAMENNCHIKYLGDGIMAIKELPFGHNCGQVRNFLHQTYTLTKDIHSFVHEVWPRPDGFRLRVTSGHVWRKHVLEHGGRRKIRNPEYVGYCVNLAQRLLEVSPKELAICHESIIEILGNKKTGFIFERLAHPKEKPRGVDPEDIAGLWTFKMDGKPEQLDLKPSAKIKPRPKKK